MLSRSIVFFNKRCSVTSKKLDDRPTVLVFTTVLLPYSQTFIRDHVTSLRIFSPLLIGLKRVPGLNLDGIRTEIIADSAVQRYLLYWFGISRKLDQIIAQTGSRLIHCHFVDGGALLARYCKRRAIPMIVTVHGSDVLRKDAGGLKTWPRNFLKKRSFKITSLFLPVSNFLMSAALRAGIPVERTRLHVLGIPLMRAPTVPRLANPPVILFVGRIVKKKGLRFLLEAAALLKTEGVQFIIKVVGDGPERPSLEAYATSLGLPVTFMDVLAPDEVRDEMDRADIYCMPSTQAEDGDNEGLPIVSMEAQSRMLPVVAFNQGPTPEAIEHGKSGILVEDRNSVELAAALKSLIDSAELRLSMGREARLLAEERFDIHTQAQKLEAIYQEVLGQMPKLAQVAP